ncbi:hypothetical protein [Brachybacterium massiliense]|uniref:hypothetical protein n=1 Tax=Brachybacterium massiliense TaxID=1755098 RepID=UPI000B3BB308|nr:hypothetical protein [Brachybacterium massiliense]
MTIYPEEVEYEPPPQSACENLVIPIDLTDELKLQTVQYIYRGLVVRFAIMLYYVSPEGLISEISRIDTCHGTVHRHRFTQGSKEELGDPQIIHRILVDGSEWEVVNSHYDQHLDQMIDEAEEYFRRWKR